MSIKSVNKFAPKGTKAPVSDRYDWKNIGSPKQERSWDKIDTENAELKLDEEQIKAANEERIILDQLDSFREYERKRIERERRVQKMKMGISEALTK